VITLGGDASGSAALLAMLYTGPDGIFPHITQVQERNDVRRLPGELISSCQSFGSESISPSEDLPSSAFTMPHSSRLPSPSLSPRILP
jgi:hypothetical protein